ncbi:MAG: peptidoglycan DD-metalloendopeptidase family protein [Lachnospiraceae bacterium]|nr:peptidoglycan DD-metalloendopeptidase family protein [Lachnospiraceae bacterium]
MKNNKAFNKMSEKRAKAVCLFMTAALALLCVLPIKGTLAAPAYTSISSDSIKQKQQEIEKAKKDKADIQSKKSNVESIKKNLEQQKNDINEYIRQIDETLEEMNYNIMDLEDQIAILEVDIERTEKEYEQAKADEDAHYEAMKHRMKMMYEKDETSILTSLLTSTSLRDLLNRMDYIEAVIAYDKASWEQLKTTRAYVDLCYQQLELSKESVDEAKRNVETEKANMEELRLEKEAQLQEYVRSIAASQAEIDSLSNQIDEFDDEIEALNKAIEVEQKQIWLAQQGKGKAYDGGSFVFPIASYKYVSSKYGWRIHPIYGTQKFHSGVDLAANYGTAIYAAYAGVVAGAGYNASMGNYVMINHGDGLYTVYMHASSLYVKEGDVVSTGQTIAAVGSTGASTGNHLHFSVRLNGEYVDPNGYIYFYDT